MHFINQIKGIPTVYTHTSVCFSNATSITPSLNGLECKSLAKNKKNHEQTCSLTVTNVQLIMEQHNDKLSIHLSLTTAITTGVRVSASLGNVM